MTLGTMTLESKSVPIARNQGGNIDFDNDIILKSHMRFGIHSLTDSAILKSSFLGLSLNFLGFKDGFTPEKNRFLDWKTAMAIWKKRFNTSMTNLNESEMLTSRRFCKTA